MQAGNYRIYPDRTAREILTTKYGRLKKGDDLAPPEVASKTTLPGNGRAAAPGHHHGIARAPLARCGQPRARSIPLADELSEDYN